jgi:hypothetical protein
MKAENYTVRELALAGWPVRISAYRVRGTWYAKADNVSPGATIASASAATQEEAEARVLEKARDRLAATRRVR